MVAMGVRGVKAGRAGQVVAWVAWVAMGEESGASCRSNPRNGKRACTRLQHQVEPTISYIIRARARLRPRDTWRVGLPTAKAPGDDANEYRPRCGDLEQRPA